MTKKQRVEGRNILLSVGIVFVVIGFLTLGYLGFESSLGVNIFLVTTIGGLTFIVGALTEMFAEDRHSELMSR